MLRLHKKCSKKEKPLGIIRFKRARWSLRNQCLCSSISRIWCSSTLMMRMALTLWQPSWKSTNAITPSYWKHSSSSWMTSAFSSTQPISSSRSDITTCLQSRRSEISKYRHSADWCLYMEQSPGLPKLSLSCYWGHSNAWNAVLLLKMLSNNISSLSQFAVKMISATIAQSGNYWIQTQNLSIGRNWEYRNIQEISQLVPCPDLSMLF